MTTPSAASGSAAGGYVAGFLLLFAVFLLVWPFIARWSTELAITEKRLIAKYGVVSTHSIEIRFDKIETVRVTQGLIGKVFNYGDIVVTGTGSTFDPISPHCESHGVQSSPQSAMETNDAVRAQRPEGNPALSRM